METFLGTGHIPGVLKGRRLELDVDWARKEVQIRLPQAQGGVTEWPGLMVQTFGTDEAVFRTKGIPPLDVHWWHVVRYSENDLWVMALALPNRGGMWPTCSFGLKRL